MKPIEPAGYFDSGMTPFYYQEDIDRLQSDNAALNLALRANKEMLAAETARADKAEQQRDELLDALERLVQWSNNRGEYVEGKPDFVEGPCVRRDINGAIAAITSVKGG